MMIRSMEYSITCEDTFDCAERLVGLGFRPVILDFASGSNPGGGWRAPKHQGTQEESLCKRSDLGLLLEKKNYPLPADGYYLNSVHITGDQKLQPLVRPFKCAVIASELRGIASRPHEYIVGKISAIYNHAIRGKHDIVVLGAWGCGAFKETDDDMRILVECYKQCIKKYGSLIQTVFAVYGKNYDKFKVLWG
jgi:hypothetical protein